MRIQHIIIAMLVFSLASVTFINFGLGFSESFGINKSNLSSGVAGLDNVINKTNIIDELSNDMGVSSETSPGGPDAISPEEITTESGLQKGGLLSTTKLAATIFTMPKTLIYSVGDFLKIPRQFQVVAFTSILVIAMLLFIGSILRNKL